MLSIRENIAATVMRKTLLPSAILVMLSSAKLEDPVFAIECLEGLMRWLLDEIEDIIKFQKKCLPPKALLYDTPRVYFLKILPKPSQSQGANIFKGVRRKFNASLQNMLEAYHTFGFINIHEITTRQKDERFFISNTSGKLSDEGTIQFWESISQTFKAIDNKLKPKSITKSQSSQWNPNDFKQPINKSQDDDMHSRERNYNYRRHQNRHDRY